MYIAELNGKMEWGRVREWKEGGSCAKILWQRREGLGGNTQGADMPLIQRALTRAFPF